MSTYHFLAGVVTAPFLLCSSFPHNESLNSIYSQILSQHFANPEYRFHASIGRLVNSVVAASLAVHHKCSQVFLPTAVKFHYIFNLRDLSNVFQGLLFSSNDCLTQPTDLVRLWMHEAQRVYGDKLTEEKDIDAFYKIQVDVVKKNFDVSVRSSGGGGEGAF